jgi:hypothetical protein
MKLLKCITGCSTVYNIVAALRATCLTLTCVCSFPTDYIHGFLTILIIKDNHFFLSSTFQLLF